MGEDESEETEMLGRRPDAEVARLTHRTLISVEAKRRMMKLPPPESSLNSTRSPTT